mgnify:CR=1 FL=1
MNWHTQPVLTQGGCAWLLVPLGSGSSQELGLYRDFAENNIAKKLQEKVLAQMFIPAEHIRVVLTDSQSLVHTRSCAITCIHYITYIYGEYPRVCPFIT